MHLSSVETYSSITGQWTTISSLSVPRCYCSATLLHGKIAVIGGKLFSNRNISITINNFLIFMLNSKVTMENHY
jgi:hypothetical protein